MTGLEPDGDIILNDDGTCACEICQVLRAAPALHSECIRRHFLALIDTDLQRIIAAWPTLPEHIRKAIAALIEAVK